MQKSQKQGLVECKLRNIRRNSNFFVHFPKILKGSLFLLEKFPEQSNFCSSIILKELSEYTKK